MRRLVLAAVVVVSMATFGWEQQGTEDGLQRFEVGVGLLLSLVGVGVAGAIGWAMSFRRVLVPIESGIVLAANAQRSAEAGLTAGFDLEARRR